MSERSSTQDGERTDTDDDPGPSPSERADDRIVEAVGRASEGLEYIERARGHLYALHQLTGRADFLLEEAAELFREAGQDEVADQLMEEIVGRNVLDGRWTFQIVEEYDAQYYGPVRDAVRGLEARFQDGRRHVYESRLKDARRSPGRTGHERRPRSAYSDAVITD